MSAAVKVVTITSTPIDLDALDGVLARPRSATTMTQRCAEMALEILRAAKRRPGHRPMTVTEVIELVALAGLDVRVRLMHTALTMLAERGDVVRTQTTSLGRTLTTWWTAT